MPGAFVREKIKIKVFLLIRLINQTYWPKYWLKLIDNRLVCIAMVFKQVCLENNHQSVCIRGDSWPELFPASCWFSSWLLFDQTPRTNNSRQTGKYVRKQLRNLTDQHPSRSPPPTMTTSAFNLANNAMAESRKTMDSIT